jgi:hypothetical protein
VADFRFGTIAHPDDGYRYGDIEFALLSDRLVVLPPAPIRPGEITITLEGTWEATGKTVEYGGVAIVPESEDATSITLIVPELHTAAGFDLLNYNTGYLLEVTDEDGTDSAILAVAPPLGTFYIGSITGAPWVFGSVFYNSTGLANGDSALVRLTAGGPIVSVGTDGLVVVSNAAFVGVRGYNEEGWGAESIVQVIDASDLTAPSILTSVIAANGESIALTFSENVVGTTGITMSGTRGPIFVTPVSGNGLDAWSFSLSRTVYLGEVVSLTYSGVTGDIKDIAGNNLAAVTRAVTNGSTVPVPLARIGTVQNQGAFVGKSFSLSLVLSFEGASGATWAVQSGTLPAGLSLNAATGVISGTPESVEAQSGLVVRATLGEATADTNAFGISVTNFSSPPGGILRPPITNAVLETSPVVKVIKRVFK